MKFNYKKSNSRISNYHLTKVKSDNNKTEKFKSKIQLFYKDILLYLGLKNEAIFKIVLYSALLLMFVGLALSIHDAKAHLIPIIIGMFFVTVGTIVTIYMIICNIKDYKKYKKIYNDTFAEYLNFKI